MVFGKKKKVVEPEAPASPKSAVISADITPGKQGKKQEKQLEPELTEAQKALVVMAQELKEEYGSYLTPVDAANVGQPVLQSEAIVLLAGIFGELKKMNMLLQEMKDEQE